MARMNWGGRQKVFARRKRLRQGNEDSGDASNADEVRTANVDVNEDDGDVVPGNIVDNEVDEVVVGVENEDGGVAGVAGAAEDAGDDVDAEDTEEFMVEEEELDNETFEEQFGANEREEGDGKDNANVDDDSGDDQFDDETIPAPYQMMMKKTEMTRG